MRIINSRDVIDFLSKSAPAVWVERVLLGMICSEELRAYFCSGKVTHSVDRRLQILLLAQKFTNYDKDEAIKNLDDYFGPSTARQFRQQIQNDRIEIDGFEFSSNEDARYIYSYLFYCANEIDWKNGTLIVELDHETVSQRGLDFDDDLFGTDLLEPDYKVELQGMSFDQSAIELLQPNIRLESKISASVTLPSRLGRPRHWDWDAAAAYLISIAQTPDGLPTGTGAQAKVERLIADWFMRETSDSPSPSQIRQHVAKLLRAIKKPEGQ